MNKTTKAKYDLAEKMLKGHIEAEEVIMMTELPSDVIYNMKKEIDEKDPTRSIEGMDVTNLDLGPLLYDDYDDTDSSDGSMDGMMPDEDNVD
jgi:hypothetical protein